MNKNWFQRHLNWTWIFAIIAGYFLDFVVAVIIYAANPYADDGVVELVMYLIMIPIMIGASIWVLKNKNRRLWWVLLSGYLSPLWLSNKTKSEND